MRWTTLQSLAEIARIVDVRQSEVNRDTKMVDAAAMSRSDLDQAVGRAYARARRNCALQRERAAAAAGGDAMRWTEKELSDATIDEEVGERQLAQLRIIGENSAGEALGSGPLVPLCNQSNGTPHRGR